MPPDLEDADINQTIKDERSEAITESLMDMSNKAETQGDMFITESTSGELAEGPEVLEVVKSRGELEEELSNFSSADLGLFSSCEHQTEHSTALIEDLQNFWSFCKFTTGGFSYKHVSLGFGFIRRVHE